MAPTAIAAEEGEMGPDLPLVPGGRLDIAVIRFGALRYAAYPASTELFRIAGKANPSPVASTLAAIRPR